MFWPCAVAEVALLRASEDVGACQTRGHTCSWEPCELRLECFTHDKQADRGRMACHGSLPGYSTCLVYMLQQIIIMVTSGAQSITHVVVLSFTPLSDMSAEQQNLCTRTRLRTVSHTHKPDARHAPSERTSQVDTAYTMKRACKPGTTTQDCSVCSATPLHNYLTH